MDQSRVVTFAKHDRVAANPFGLGIVGKVTHHCVECAGQINIVAVDERENVARGFFETFVDRVYLPAIFFTYPVSQLVLVAANDRDTLISASSVDDDVLERLITLIQYRQDRLFQEMALVE